MKINNQYLVQDLSPRAKVQVNLDMGQNLLNRLNLEKEGDRSYSPSNQVLNSEDFTAKLKMDWEKDLSKLNEVIGEGLDIIQNESKPKEYFGELEKDLFTLDDKLIELEAIQKLALEKEDNIKSLKAEKIYLEGELHQIVKDIRFAYNSAKEDLSELSTTSDDNINSVEITNKQKYAQHIVNELSRLNQELNNDVPKIPTFGGGTFTQEMAKLEVAQNILEGNNKETEVGKTIPQPISLKDIERRNELLDMIIYRKQKVEKEALVEPFTNWYNTKFIPKTITNDTTQLSVEGNKIENIVNIVNIYQRNQDLMDKKQGLVAFVNNYVNSLNREADLLEKALPMDNILSNLYKTKSVGDAFNILNANKVDKLKEEKGILKDQLKKLTAEANYFNKEWDRGKLSEASTTESDIDYNKNGLDLLESYNTIQNKIDEIDKKLGVPGFGLPKLEDIKESDKLQLKQDLKEINLKLKGFKTDEKQLGQIIKNSAVEPKPTIVTQSQPKKTTPLEYIQAYLKEVRELREPGVVSTEFSNKQARIDTLLKACETVAKKNNIDLNQFIEFEEVKKKLN